MTDDWQPSNGERVTFCGGGDFLVVGPDPCPQHREHTVVFGSAEGDGLEDKKFRSYRNSDLDPYPDNGIIVTMKREGRVEVTGRLSYEAAQVGASISQGMLRGEAGSDLRNLLVEALVAPEESYS